MISVDLKLKLNNILVHYRSGSIAIIIHLISIFLFGLGLASPSNFVKEYSTFILFYAGFISIINSFDLGYSIVIAKGEALYFRGMLYLLALSILVSSIALGILDIFFDLRIHYSLLFIYIFLGFWLNIARSFFDRLKWFVLGTIFGNHFLLIITVIPAFIYSPKSFSEWWEINIILTLLLLLISILILYRSNRIFINHYDDLDNSWKQIKTNWKMSLIYFQGNFNGRIDRFLYPLFFLSELPTAFLFINEAAHRLLFITSAAIRFNIPEYGSGKKLLGNLSFLFRSRILISSFIINTLIIFASVTLVGQNLENEYKHTIVLLYAFAASVVVLSQYEFFRLIIKTSYNVIIYSQFIGILAFIFLVILSNGSLLILALGYVCKCIVEYIVLSRGCNC